MTNDRKLMLKLGVVAVIAFAVIAAINLHLEADAKRLREQSRESSALSQELLASINKETARLKQEAAAAATQAEARSVYASKIFMQCQLLGGRWDPCMALAEKYADREFPKRPPS